jgi:hypothetical protein
VTSLPLKRGMLHYAYSRGLPVQIIITSNKEAVISEKMLSAHFGQTVLVGYAEPIHAKARCCLTPALAFPLKHPPPRL